MQGVQNCAKLHENPPSGAFYPLFLWITVWKVWISAQRMQCIYRTAYTFWILQAESGRKYVAGMSPESAKCLYKYETTDACRFAG